MNYFALSLNNPKTIISFARSNNLLDKMLFCHLTQYFRSNAALDIARILKDSTSPAGIKNTSLASKSPKESRMQLISIRRMETSYGKSSLRQSFTIRQL
jgi:hypothetical protein